MPTFSDISDQLAHQAIELPSWAFGNSGTRFKVFGTPGTPRTVFEKIADAAKVHRLTGLAPSVALHIPWDEVDDYAALGAYADELGVRLGTINSNTFQDDDYKFGSLTHIDKTVRQKAIDHHLVCIDIMNADRFAGPEDLARRRHELPGPGRHPRPPGPAGRIAGHDLRHDRRRPATGAGVQVLRARVVHDRCAGLGNLVRPGAPRSVSGRVVCLDTGHHAPGTNIEFIVAQLLRLGKLGSFDFNSRFYADDDLIVGAADPFQLFRIMFEVMRGGGLDAGLATSRSCSTSATTSRPRSPARSARCSTCRR